MEIMDEEKQDRPLAPRDRFVRSDVSMFVYKEKKSGRKERSSKCLVCILFLMVILGVSVLVFSIVFLRVRSPKLEISSMAVENLKFVNGNSSTVSINATLVAQVKVSNTNYGGFKFDDGNVTVLYGGTKTGQGSIKIGALNGKESKVVKVVMEIKSNELLHGGGGTRMMTNLSGSVNSGMVNVTNFAKLNGVFDFYDVFTKRRTSDMNCSMTLVLVNSTVQNSLCN